VRGHAAGRRRAGDAALAVLVAAAACSGHGSAAPTSARPTAASACARRPVYARPSPTRPRYRLDVRIPARGRVTGTLAVVFTPDLATGRLVFRLWPNGPRQAREGSRLSVSDVRLGGRPAAAALTDPTTLVVRRGRPFAAGVPVRASMRFALRVPGPVTDRLARAGGSLRLGSFFPLLPWEPGVGWDTDPATTSLAETSSSPTADFSVRLHLPAGTSAIASGDPAGDGVWRARAVRDFAVAVGRFRAATVTAHAPRPVRVVVGVAAGMSVRPAAVAGEVGDDLVLLSHRFGPYPWPSLRVAVLPGQRRLGIEYPAMLFLGAGTRGDLTRHEVAHQWFYSLVGDDQARDPVLDEGLATYAMGPLPVRFKVTPAFLRLTGEPMSFWQGRPYRAYQLGVYIDGARAARSLGPRSLVDCALRAYVAHNAYGIATQAGFVKAVATVIPSAPRTLARFGIPARRG
jgi:hypothetical protein